MKAGNHSVAFGSAFGAACVIQAGGCMEPLDSMRIRGVRIIILSATEFLLVKRESAIIRLETLSLV